MLKRLKPLRFFNILEYNVVPRMHRTVLPYFLLVVIPPAGVSAHARRSRLVVDVAVVESVGGERLLEIEKFSSCTFTSMLFIYRGRELLLQKSSPVRCPR